MHLACLLTHGGKLTHYLKPHGKVCYSASLRHCWLIHVGLSLAVNKCWISLKNGTIVLSIFWSRDKTQQRTPSSPLKMTPALKLQVPSFGVIRTQGGQKCFCLRDPQRRFTSQLCALCNSYCFCLPRIWSYLAHVTIQHIPQKRILNFQRQFVDKYRLQIDPHGKLHLQPHVCPLHITDSRLLPRTKIIKILLFSRLYSIQSGLFIKKH